MKKRFFFLIFISFPLLLGGTFQTHLVHDLPTRLSNGEINVVIEISAGGFEKWEVDKTTGQLALNMKNGAPRLIQYLGYPANYGMVPQTMMSKESGGDGDPLDVLVLGGGIERGQVVSAKVIGVLALLDKGERDDKLIAVRNGTHFYQVNNLKQLEANYNGLKKIMKIWFQNYKGKKKIKVLGYKDKAHANVLINDSIQAYRKNRQNKERL